MIFNNALSTFMEKRRPLYVLRRCFSLTVTCLWLLLLTVMPVAAQGRKTADALQASPAQDAIFNYDGDIYKHQDRRDPFFHLPKPPESKVVEDVEISRGTPPPGIAGTYIAGAALEGIAIRQANKRTAVIRGNDKKAYFLHEGDRLFDGYLKTIGDDSAVFVRERRMKSGKTLTEEVTKRLRKQ